MSTYQLNLFLALSNPSRAKLTRGRSRYAIKGECSGLLVLGCVTIGYVKGLE